MHEDAKAYCEGCKKKSTVHLTEIIDGKITEMHLCEDCPLLQEMQMEKQFGLSDLLAGLANFGKQVQVKGDPDIACENCGLKYEQFQKYGRLGCSDCYQTFRAPLADLLKKIHGTNQHLGKSPLSVKSIKGKADDALSELKRKLGEAIRGENFEEAGRLRDQIRALETKQKPG